MSVWGTILSWDGTWPEDRPPIHYQGSHRIPRGDDPGAGLFEISSISSELTEDGDDDGPGDGPPLPFLRLSVAERLAGEGDIREPCHGGLSGLFSAIQEWRRGELLGTAPDMQTVILDAAQVRELRDALTDWFHAPEDDGKRSWACPHCGGTGEAS